jgi:hypothetical protein
MQRASLIPLLLLTLLVGCAASNRQPPAVRVLTSETPHVRAESEAGGDIATPAVTPPRLGAPGGSGAGSRRVAPAAVQAGTQSGNDTVGGLPPGTGGVVGPLG